MTKKKINRKKFKRNAIFAMVFFYRHEIILLKFEIFEAFFRIFFFLIKLRFSDRNIREKKNFDKMSLPNVER